MGVCRDILDAGTVVRLVFRCNYRYGEVCVVEYRKTHWLRTTCGSFLDGVGSPGTHRSTRLKEAVLIVLL